MGLLPFMQRDLGPLTPFARFARLRAETDELLFELIAERRAEDAERDDVLAMLLEARHEDGSEMSRQELRDELMTLLVAGHETTASELAWAFERLVRTPTVLARLVEEIDREDRDDDAYLTATIQETLRRRPVLPKAAPRLVKQPVEIGDGPTRPACAWSPSPTSSTTTRRSTTIPTRSGRSASGRAAGDLHLDPLRRRSPPLPRGELRHARDEGRAARGAVARRGALRPRGARADPPSQHHREPTPRRGDRAARARFGTPPEPYPDAGGTQASPRTRSPNPVQAKFMSQRATRSVGSSGWSNHQPASDSPDFRS